MAPALAAHLQPQISLKELMFPLTAVDCRQHNLTCQQLPQWERDQWKRAHLLPN